jgi:hypothetical protein
VNQCDEYIMSQGLFASLIASFAGLPSVTSLFAMKVGEPAFELDGATFKSSFGNSSWLTLGDRFYRYQLDELADFTVCFPKRGEIVDVDIPLTCSQFGPMGIRSYADRIDAMCEYAIRYTDGVTCLVLPYGYWGTSQGDPRNTDVLEGLRRFGYDYLHFSIPAGAIELKHGVTLSFFRKSSQHQRLPEPVWASFDGYYESAKLSVDILKAFNVARLMKRRNDHRQSNGMVDPERIRAVAYSDTPNFEVLEYAGSVDPKVSIHVSNGAALKIKPVDDLARLQLEVARREIGAIPNISTKGSEHLIDLRMRRANLAREPVDYTSITDQIMACGADVIEAHDVQSWLDSVVNRYATKVTPPYEQCINVGDNEWSWINQNQGIRHVSSQAYNEWLDRIDKRIPWPFWDFSRDDLARALTKGKALYAAYKGLGKTRFAISFIQARGGKRNLILLERRLFNEFIDEARSIGYPVEEIHQILNASDAEPENLKTINLVSYSMVWRATSKSFRGSGRGKNKRPKKSIAHVLRKVRFNAMIIDEVHKLSSGSTTKQGEYSLLIRSKCKVGMTGTPISNYPKDIVAVLVQIFGEATEWVDVSLTKPIEDIDGGQAMQGKKYFAKKYVAYAEVTEKFEGGKAKRREMPIIKPESLDDFRVMMSRIMIRRHRHEPQVAAAIHVPKPDRAELGFDIDKQHADFYLWWLNSFYDWFREQLDRERLGKQSVDSVLLLRQLGKLQFAANIPQASEVHIEGQVSWSGGLTAKQRGAIDKTLELVGQGEKVILFSVRPKVLELFSNKLALHGMQSSLFHGGIQLEERLENLSAFKTDPDYPVLLATYGTANTGYNIPQADSIISFDWDWIPATMDQAESRILRSAWLTPERQARGQKPKIFRSKLRGTIDEYMEQLVVLKSKGTSEAIDYQEVEINPEDFMSWKDFTIRMLRDLGYEV